MNKWFVNDLEGNQETCNIILNPKYNDAQVLNGDETKFWEKKRKIIKM